MFLKIAMISTLCLSSACSNEETINPVSINEETTSASSGTGGSGTVNNDIDLTTVKTQPGCAIDQQDYPGCDACAKPLFPKMPTATIVAFSQCYNDKANGCLEGDGTICSEKQPVGAEEWKELVEDICSSCAAKCCYFCTTEFGRLAP